MDESQAIHEMLMENYRDVHAFVTKRFPQKLKPFIEVNDVVQEVCIRAAEAYSKSRPTNRRAWLLTIAKNVVIDLMQRHRSLKRGAGKIVGEDGLNRVDQVTVVMLQDLVIYRRTPSRSALRRELILVLEEALLRITEAQQAAVKLRFFEGLTSAEAALHMGLSEPAFRQLAKRALAAIRHELQPYSLGAPWTM